MIYSNIPYEQLSSLSPIPGIYILTSAVTDSALDFLSEQEAASVVDAADRRRREFATARALAREGLRIYFDLHNFELLNGRDRAPVWPPGISGSISHSSTRAWVALTDAARGTVGIDGESRLRLDRELWHLTMHSEEIVYLESLQASLQERRALTIFSAKEALYKAQYPRSRQFMDFTAVSVHIHEDATLQCIFNQIIGPFDRGFVANGRWLEAQDIVTTVFIPAEEKTGGENTP